jgi:hypothetical protein
VLNATREKKYDGSCRKRCQRKTISAGSVPPKTLAIIAEGPAMNNTAAVDDLADRDATLWHKLNFKDIS